MTEPVGKRPPRKRARRDLDDGYRVAFGATATRDKDDLAYVRQQLHDEVIADLGDNRTGGVTWRWWPALTGARVLVENELVEDGPQRSGLLRYLRANPGGYLVIAMAPGRMPDPADANPAPAGGGA